MNFEEQVDGLESRVAELERLLKPELAQTRCGNCSESLQAWELPQDPHPGEVAICDRCAKLSAEKPSTGTLDKGSSSSGVSSLDPEPFSGDLPSENGQP